MTWANSHRIKHNEMQLSFTDEQITAAADLIDKTADDVRDVVFALNDMLLSDPPQTMRRSPDGNWLAIRRASLHEPYETLSLGRGGGVYSDPNLNIVNWPVIWQPSPGDKIPRCV